MGVRRVIGFCRAVGVVGAMEVLGVMRHWMMWTVRSAPPDKVQGVKLYYWRYLRGGTWVVWGYEGYWVLRGDVGTGGDGGTEVRKYGGTEVRRYGGTEVPNQALLITTISYVA